MNRFTKSSLLALTFLAMTVCGGREEPQTEAPASEAPATAMDSMAPMDMSSTAMMSDMMAHMQRMDGMATDSMLATIPAHRQMVANMVAQMNGEMRAMNMTADAAWNATIDSVRADLQRMPEMSAEELQALMPDHRARVMRLMEAHRAMMGGMQM